MTTAEKLAELGLQPFCGRKIKNAVRKPASQPPTIPAGGDSNSSS